MALAQLPDLIISDVTMPRFASALQPVTSLSSHSPRAQPRLTRWRPRGGPDDYASKFCNTLHAKADVLLRSRRKLHTLYQRRILLQPTKVVVANANREFLEKAMHVVEGHPGAAEFNVQVLVRAMVTSQSVFYRRIKSITGQTAVEFIRDVRLKRATQLLTHTTMRVSEVAFEVGIEDAKYFRKAFQKLYSRAPSECAKQYQAVASTGPAAH